MLYLENFIGNRITNLNGAKPSKWRAMIRSRKEDMGSDSASLHLCMASQMAMTFVQDIKATQGDTGHSQADMVTKVYAHILDEDRKVNAQKFESAFYANPDLRGVQAPAEPAPALDVQSIILQLQQSPELLSALTSLISNQGCK